jgi:hypothetical protein
LGAHDKTREDSQWLKEENVHFVETKLNREPGNYISEKMARSTISAKTNAKKTCSISNESLGEFAGVNITQNRPLAHYDTLIFL